MSTFEERLMLQKLEALSKTCSLPPHMNRFRRKLLLRQVWSRFCIYWMSTCSWCRCCIYWMSDMYL